MPGSRLVVVPGGGHLMMFDSPAEVAPQVADSWVVRTPALDRYARVVSDRKTPPSLGDIIRRQRELAELPMRQLASMVGISGPYLSQIERGLRAPSDQVLGAIAKSLKTSAEALQNQAEALAPEQPSPSAVVAAIGEDPDLTVRQRQALIEVYTALTEATVARRRRGRGRDEDDEGPGTEDGSGPGEGGAASVEDGADRADVRGVDVGDERGVRADRGLDPVGGRRVGSRPLELDGALHGLLVGVDRLPAEGPSDFCLTGRFAHIEGDQVECQRNPQHHQQRQRQHDAHVFAYHLRGPRTTTIAFQMPSAARADEHDEGQQLQYPQIQPSMPRSAARSR